MIEQQRNQQGKHDHHRQLEQDLVQVGLYAFKEVDMGEQHGVEVLQLHPFQLNLTGGQRAGSVEAVDEDVHNGLEGKDQEAHDPWQHHQKGEQSLALLITDAGKPDSRLLRGAVCSLFRKPFAHFPVGSFHTWAVSAGMDLPSCVTSDSL